MYSFINGRFITSEGLLDILRALAVMMMTCIAVHSAHGFVLMAHFRECHADILVTH